MFKDFCNSLPNFFHLFWKHVIIPACKTWVKRGLLHIPQISTNPNLQKFKIGNMKQVWQFRILGYKWQELRRTWAQNKCIDSMHINVRSFAEVLQTQIFNNNYSETFHFSLQLCFLCFFLMFMKAVLNSGKW